MPIQSIDTIYEPNNTLMAIDIHSKIESIILNIQVTFSLYATPQLYDISIESSSS